LSSSFREEGAACAAGVLEDDGASLKTDFVGVVVFFVRLFAGVLDRAALPVDFTGGPGELRSAALAVLEAETDCLLVELKA
jgi:hypothetical protein